MYFFTPHELLLYTVHDLIAAKAEKGVSLMPAKLMVVDDMELLLSFTSEILQAAGYEVFGTSDIPEAISTFADFAPDCCVLDYHMPDMLGSELANRLRKLDPYVGIIFLTADEGAGLTVTLMNGGAIDYLIKPVDSNRLLASISRALEHRRRLKENLD